MEIIAYELQYAGDSVENSGIVCIPFKPEFFQAYMRIYNECFYPMRKALDIQPYNFLNEYSQIAEKIHDIHLLVREGEIIGSVACYGNEIDDLIVNRRYQHKGYGRQLLLWAMQHIRALNAAPITLHVAEWNQHALRLYRNAGFEIVNAEIIRRS